MPQLITRVELRGEPGGDTYQSLHQFMEGLGWSRTITGSRDNALPSGTYQGTSTTANPTFVEMADSLKREIETAIWNPALVFILQSATWAITTG